DIAAVAAGMPERDFPGTLPNSGRNQANALGELRTITDKLRNELFKRRDIAAVRFDEPRATDREVGELEQSAYAFADRRAAIYEPFVAGRLEEAAAEIKRFVGSFDRAVEIPACRHVVQDDPAKRLARQVVIKSSEERSKPRLAGEQCRKMV